MKKLAQWVTTHESLVDEMTRKPSPAEIEEWRRKAERERLALLARHDALIKEGGVAARVATLHAPVGGEFLRCHGCGIDYAAVDYQDWPCATWSLIAEDVR